MQSLPRLRYVSLLHLKPTAMQHVDQIHAQLTTNGVKSTSLLAKLIQQYCCIDSPQSSKRAHFVFTHFGEPDLFLFNTLLRCIRPKDSILVFANWVSKRSLVFDEFTYNFVLGACARFSSASTLWLGRQVHVLVLKHGFMWNPLVQTTLVHFYGSNRDVYSGRRVFDEMTVRSSATWNAMITGYCSQRDKASECAYSREALLLFQDMLGDACGVKLTDTTMVCVLSASSQLGVLETGACIHGYIEKSGYVPENNVFIGTGLVDMYSKCGCLDSALSAFEGLRERNVLTWTAMATGLAVHGKGKEALELLDAMGAAGIEPNAVTFTSLFSACCHVGLISEGLHLFKSMRSKFALAPQIQHYGCIVDLLGRAGHLKEAYDFIMGMPVKPDAILWRSLLSACKVHGDVVMSEKVGKILLHLQPEQSSIDPMGKSEDYVALSNVYASAEKWQEVARVRKEMKKRRIKSKPGCSSVQTISNDTMEGL